MAYGLKYVGTFQATGYKETKVEIYEDGFAGEFEPIHMSMDGCTVEWGARSDDLFEEPLRLARGTIQIFDKDQDLYSAFYTHDPRRFQVRILHGSNLDFIGYIEIEQYLRVLDKRKNTVRFNVQDALAILDDSTYTSDPEGSDFIDLIEFLQLLLAQTGQSRKLNTATNWRSFWGSQTDTDNPLKDMQVPRHRYTGYKISEILKDICNQHNCELYQQDGEWWFANPTYSVDDFRIWTYLPNGDLDDTSVVSNNIKRIDEGGHTDYRLRVSGGEESPIRNFTDTYQNYVHERKTGLYHVRSASAFRDPQFMSWKDDFDDRLACWERVGELNVTSLDTSPNRGAKIIGHPYNENNYLTQTIKLDPRTIRVRSVILIKTKFVRDAASGLRDGRLRIRWGNYYLDNMVRLTPNEVTGGIPGLTLYHEDGDPSKPVFAANNWTTDDNNRVRLQWHDDEIVNYTWILSIFPGDIPEDIGEGNDDFEIRLYQLHGVPDSFPNDELHIYSVDFQVAPVDEGDINFLEHYKRERPVLNHERIKNILLSEYGEANLIKDMPTPLSFAPPNFPARASSFMKRGAYGVNEDPLNQLMADLAAYERLIVRNSPTTHIRHNVSYIYRDRDSNPIGHRLKYGNWVRIANRFFKILYLKQEYKDSRITVEHATQGETVGSVERQITLIGRVPTDASGATIPTGGVPGGGVTGPGPGNGEPVIGGVLRRGTVEVTSANTDTQVTFASLDDAGYYIVLRGTEDDTNVGVDISDKQIDGFKVNASAPCTIEWFII